jgi:hypothetical protein
MMVFNERVTCPPFSHGKKKKDFLREREIILSNGSSSSTTRFSILLCVFDVWWGGVQEGHAQIPFFGWRE